MNKKTMDNQLLSEAVQYFSSQKGFGRLIDGMVEKYRSLGHWGGSVRLEGLKEGERDALGTFFRKDYSRQKSATISLARFAKALEQTRFGEISPLDILESIKGEKLLSKAEEYSRKEETKRDFFERLLNQYTNEYCQIWLNSILEKQPGTRSVYLTYERDPEILKLQMEHILQALQELQGREAKPDLIERLPVFARRITKDPHSFDQSSETGRLLIHALRVLNRYRLPRNDESILLPGEELSETEALNELFYSYGLLRDDLWNFVTCTGIVSDQEGIDIDGKGSPVGYLEKAYQERVTLNLPLREVVKFERATPGNPLMNRVYVVENSGVFSALLDLFEEYCRENGLDEMPNPPLICTHGQFKLASLLLLDKLALNGSEIYYSGDFDPEGLMMLERLKQRYPDKLVPWHYSLKDYQACISDQTITLARLKKLDKIKSPETQPLKEEIKKSCLAGYQEGLLEVLWEDISRYIHSG